jgi:hypothetical protein
MFIRYLCFGVCIIDSIFIVITESDLISSEKLLIERVKEDENIHIDPTSKPPIVS